MRSEIAFAHQLTVGVEGYLARDVDDPAGGGIDDVAVTERRRQCFRGKEALFVHPPMLARERKRPAGAGLRVVPGWLYAAARARRRSKRSIRLPRLTARSLPVYAGWHCEQTSTWIEAAVDRVSKVVPQLEQLTVVVAS